MTEYIDKGGNADGTLLGRETTSLVGFWGTTPCDQAAALTESITALVVQSASASMTANIEMKVAATTYGFSTLSVACTFLTNLRQMQVRQKEVENALVAAGLFAGGTAVTDETAVEYIGMGDDEGMVLGRDADDLVGFWGTAPQDQPAKLTVPVTLTVMPLMTVMVTVTQILAQEGKVEVTAQSLTAFGFSTYNQGGTFMSIISSVERRITEVETRLAELGIIAGATAKDDDTLYDVLDYGGEGGVVLGKSTAKIGFWGATPVAQIAALTTAAVTLVVSASTTASTNTIATLTAHADAIYIITSGMSTFLDAAKRLQIRQGEIETGLETLGLLADDSVSG